MALRFSPAPRQRFGEGYGSVLGELVFVSLNPRLYLDSALSWVDFTRAQKWQDPDNIPAWTFPRRSTESVYQNEAAATTKLKGGVTNS